MPDWVRRWSQAREAGDDRLFPEQADGIRSLHFNHGYPLGELKDVGGKSGYEDEYLIAETVPIDDRDRWVQPHEYADPPLA